jgi:hypothetical protein
MAYFLHSKLTEAALSQYGYIQMRLDTAILNWEQRHINLKLSFYVYEHCLRNSAKTLQAQILACSRGGKE